MSFAEILSTLLIGPLKLIFEIIYQVAYRFIGHPGLAIIVLSLVMNILVLPLYRRADAMQEAARDIDAKLHDGVAHIKKVFSGDERMMILQTYYRQNHYKPTDALNGSVSLLLEIPFFIAAYQFLSHLDLLKGVSLGPIADLSAPDGLLVIGGLAINLLPVLMTVCNVVSSMLYLKGFPLKAKLQLYGMALFFLIFLYTSPSGLVFYWTLNNVFSLVKNIFYKLKNPRKILALLTSAAGALSFVFGAFLYETPSVRRKVFLAAVGILLQLPLLLHLLLAKNKIRLPQSQPHPNRKLFLAGSVFLTVLIGALIPSALIAASPQEFIVFGVMQNPLWYVVSTLCLAAGTFLIWLGVFYWLADARGKALFDKLVWVLSGVMLVNYMFFGTNLGVISPALQYEHGLTFSMKEQAINLLVIVLIALVLLILLAKWNRITVPVLLTASIALGGMSALNASGINRSINQVHWDSTQSSSAPHFQLSKTGKNVVVIMLDRALGQYIPYLFQEKPELQEQFSGFTHYANTISFGGSTNFGVPPLYGGYEYTPVEMNRRDSEPLVDKHDEALKVMPVLFAEQGYDVTVCDPPYAGYQWIPDLSIYGDYPEIHAYITEGKFLNAEQLVLQVQNNFRNLFCFSVMKTLPVSIQFSIYDMGHYNQAGSAPTVQTQAGISVAEGLYDAFMEAYTVLENLPAMTNLSAEADNTFLLMSNNTTHEPMLLQTPEYIPAESVDNTTYDTAHSDRFTINGKTLKMESAEHMIHYHANMAAMLQLGSWFDYLRENDVYDNTRIILVSDHGSRLKQMDALMTEDSAGNPVDLEGYGPLLMVKDFNSTGFQTSDAFMTHADVPTLATDALIANPQNPFTGKAINSDEKTAHEQFIIMSTEWETTVNDGNTFLPSQWASVKDDLWNKNNWTVYEGEIVLREHKAP